MDLWMIKYRVLAWRMDNKTKLKRAIFCRHNQHELQGASVETFNRKGGDIKCDFVRCKNCGLHYFPSKEHRDDYLKYNQQQKSEQENMNKMWANMIKDSRGE